MSEPTAVIEPAADTVEPTPPSFKRNDDGLVEGVTYPRRPDDGRIDWVKLIKPQHVVFNSKLDATLEKVYGAPAKSLSYGDLIAAGKEVDPKHVLVLLQGFVEVARLRGYRNALPRIAHVCSYPVEAAICSCECTIEWLPNVEEPDGFTSYGTADATMENTGGWGYLSAMAGNRAFVRAVRQGLAIPILGFDEIAKKDTAIPESAPQPTTAKNMAAATLQKCAEAGGYTFDTVKKSALTNHRPKMESDPEQWTKWDDVAPRDCLTLIKLIKEKTKKTT